jgi:hypothetical protein
MKLKILILISICLSAFIVFLCINRAKVKEKQRKDKQQLIVPVDAWQEFGNEMLRKLSESHGNQLITTTNWKQSGQIELGYKSDGTVVWRPLPESPKP